MQRHYTFLSVFILLALVFLILTAPAVNSQTIVQHNLVTTSTGGTITATLPYPSKAGNLLVVVIADAWSGPSDPTGWTQVYCDPNNVNGAVFYKVSAGEQSVVLATGTLAGVAEMIEITGQAATSPVTVGTALIDSSTATVKPSVTVKSAGGLVLSIITSGSGGATQSAKDTSPSGQANLPLDGGNASSSSCPSGCGEALFVFQSTGNPYAAKQPYTDSIAITTTDFWESDSVLLWIAPNTTYADANIAPAGWQFPYEPDPFNIPTCVSDPCSPPYDPNSTAEMKTIFTGLVTNNEFDNNVADSIAGLGVIQVAQPGTNGSGQSDEYPIYYASASDPVYTVNCDGYGACAYASAQIHIPNGAKASIDGDHHMTVIYLPTNTEYDFWEFNDNGSGTGQMTPQATCNNGTVGNSCETYSVSKGINSLSGNNVISVAGAGVCTTGSFANGANTCTSYNGAPGGATAAGIPPQAGLIDPRELLSEHISHVIFIATPCESSSDTWVYPAINTDGPSARSNCTPSNALGPLDGQRVWLDLSDEAIEALLLPSGAPMYRWAKTLYHQMHHYGFMLVDTAGGYPWDMDTVDDNTFINAGLPSQWALFFNEVNAEAGGSYAYIDYAANASHLAIPTSSGVLPTNFHVLQGCVNTLTCAYTGAP